MNFFRNHDKRNIQIHINLTNKITFTFFNNNNNNVCNNQIIQIDNNRHKICKNVYTKINNVDFQKRNKTKFKKIETRSIRNFNIRNFDVLIIILLIFQIYFHFR